MIYDFLLALSNYEVKKYIHQLSTTYLIDCDKYLMLLDSLLETKKLSIKFAF